MATFVLVHGAWAGAHGFRHVRRLLQEEGHEVFTPSLTGIGERAHLTSPQVTLGTHIHDVVNQVLYEDLDAHRAARVFLRRCGGDGSLLHIADRVRHLVYLDAFVPGDGESLASLAGQPDGGRIGVADEWLVPPVPRSYDDDAEAAFMTPRRVAHPRACFSDPSGSKSRSRTTSSNAPTSARSRMRPTRRQRARSMRPRGVLVPRAPGTIAKLRRTTWSRATALQS